MRRLRGLLGLALAGSVPWALAGFVIGLLLQFDFIPRIHVGLTRPFPGGLPVATALAGGIIGAINGTAFGALLWAGERGKQLEELRSSRVAIWGGLATAITLGLIFQSTVIATGGGIVGALAALGALRLARHAVDRAAQPGIDSPAS
jgi:hypothetical protein